MFHLKNIQQHLSLNILASIPRKDVRRDIRRDGIRKRQTTISLTRNGIELSIPQRRKERLDISNKALLFWGVVSFLILSTCVSLWEFLQDYPVLGFLCVAIPLGLCSVCGVLGMFLLFGKEHLRIERDEMKHGISVFGLWKPTTYALCSVSHLRVAPQGNRLLFDDGETSITCCQGIDRAEASSLVHTLTEILTFQCQSVQRILFGSLSFPEDDPSRTLRNPDVSTLTFPFVHLRTVIIETATYDVHSIERFLTYAVNMLGQTYLRNHVDVQIYGDWDDLPPHLKNSLTNLCRKVYREEKPDPIHGF
jgi:hypothetical protein